LDKSNEHLSYQSISTYLNLKQVLSGKEINFIETHLKSCSTCKEEFETVYNEDMEMDNEVGEKKHKKTEIEFQSNTIKIFKISNFAKYAAAAAILVVVTIIYFYLSSKDDRILTQELQSKDSVTVKENRKEDLIVDKDSSNMIKSSPEEYIAEDISLSENFRENRILENFINRNVRSETIVQIISPSIEDTLSEPVIFKWLKPGGTNFITLILVDNKNKALYKANVDGNEIKYGGKLKPGLYYWKIESNGKLEVVGKFYIKAP
jgi:hypothetical protein